jgi:hypothetical protein
MAKGHTKKCSLSMAKNPTSNITWPDKLDAHKPGEELAISIQPCAHHIHQPLRLAY